MTLLSTQGIWMIVFGLVSLAELNHHFYKVGLFSFFSIAQCYFPLPSFIVSAVKYQSHTLFAFQKRKSYLEPSYYTTVELHCIAWHETFSAGSNLIWENGSNFIHPHLMLYPFFRLVCLTCKRNEMKNYLCEVQKAFIQSEVLKGCST